MVSWEHGAFFWLWSFPWELGEPPCEPQSGCPFSQGDGQTFSECGLFPKENGGPTCEGPARELILRKGDNHEKRCNEREKEKEKEKAKERNPAKSLVNLQTCFSFFTILLYCRLTYRQNRFFMFFLWEIDTFSHHPPARWWLEWNDPPNKEFTHGHFCSKIPAY